MFLWRERDQTTGLRSMNRAESDFYEIGELTDKEFAELPPLVKKGEDQRSVLMGIVDNWMAQGEEDDEYTNEHVKKHAGDFYVPDHRFYIDRKAFVDENTGDPIDLALIFRMIEERIIKNGDPSSFQSRPDLYVLIRRCRIDKCDCRQHNMRPVFVAWGTKFGDNVNFSNAQFGEGADFGRSIFGKNANFKSTIFCDGIDFERTQFGKNANFSQATFGKGASFFTAVFGSDVCFANSRFDSQASFHGTIFNGDANLYALKFGERADFTATQFNGEANLKRTQYGIGASFRGARFHGRAEFTQCHFNKVKFIDVIFFKAGDFGNALFCGGASFWRSDFGCNTSFKHTVFDGQSEFDASVFGDDTSFEQAHFSERAFFENTEFGKCANFSEATFEKGALFDQSKFKKGARFWRAMLPKSDMRLLDGFVPDETFIRESSFPARSRDNWSRLRSAYSGPRLLFNLLFLIVFFLPFVARTIGLVATGNFQQDAVVVIDAIDKSIQNNENENPQLSKWSRSLIEVLKQNMPGYESDKWEKSQVWRVLLGVDKGPGILVPAILLLLYNLGRGALTYMISPMRDAEERSGWTPALRSQSGKRRAEKYQAAFEEVERIENGSDVWVPSVQQKIGVKIHWAIGLTEAYGWLIWPHKILTVLLWFALLSFMWNALHWLKMPIWLPVF